MMLLKRFMVWAIGLKQLLEPQQRQPASLFRTLSVKLLLSYLGGMTAVMGLSGVAVYQFFSYSLSQELDSQLATLADAARHNLVAIQQDRSAADRELPVEIDHDGDLDLSWQDLHRSAQMVEWFNAEGIPLAQAGNSLPQRPLIAQFQPYQQDQIRSLTQPVFSEQDQALQGYVRVSIPVQVMAEELKRLQLGMGVGGSIAICLIGTTGWWLTQRSLRPVKQTVEKLQQFTADASHELRSPITAIKIATAVMQSHPERVHPIDQRKLAVIAEATEQMTLLVEDLLLLARLDHQTGESFPIRLPLHEVLEDLMDWFQPQAVASGLQLQFECLSEVWIVGHAIQLRRAFLNIIDNALKYTSAGGRVSVALVKKSLGTQEAVARVVIKDTGIGIAPEQLPQIFDRFWRADGSRDRKVGGTGLGLAIAQAIVEAHHGRITVKSRLGEGSCFDIELPIVQ